MSSDEPESIVDQKTFEEQQRQAERFAMELMENEEAEKQAQAKEGQNAKPAVSSWADFVRRHTGIGYQLLWI